MQRNATTQHPIVLVHGLFGFDSIGSLDLFYGVKQALRSAGTQVFIPHLSATHSNEVRGQQLLAQVDRILAGTGTTKVNLVGHSQGALAARYAAAVTPERVASVTSVSGPNHGSELADCLRKALTPGHLPEQIAEAVATLFVEFLAFIAGTPKIPHNAIAALNALTTEGVADFNAKYPQGLPSTWGGNGQELVNGVRYFSWSGIVGNLRDEGRNALDPLHHFCRAFSRFFTREAEQNDGMVGRYSSHLGTVLRSDYPLDHLDTINQTAGLVRQGIDPVELYLAHAEHLKQIGL
ncbi:triacylglycerol lipase [Pseudomonas sp. ok272]|uniref:esterase/lipase family protein n=1 Tax=unclassified Pseudomonas TaxID=196821 RepID=UPI0008B204DE|nr:MULTISPECIES: triacylglycerol lipase [unclassified Pseudomonas]SEM48106.1 triacylglycerol lipase [Pseudomonas sp. ok272]SFM19679.1 triacylglycerol lipase [Pseudomonas sp. ok602]